MSKVLKICHLYPEVLNLYGDRGNILCMKKRLEWRGIDVDIHNKKSISADINLIPIEDAINWNVYVAYEKSKACDVHVKAFLDMLR